MINKITIQGRVTADPELRYVPSTGKAVVKFSIANDIGYGDKKKTSFPNFVGWDKKAEYIANYAKKGTMVVIEGTYSENAYTDKDGNKRRNTEIVVNEIFIPYDNKNTSEGQNFTPEGYGNSGEIPEGYTALSEDDVPF